jgi:Ca-activated chloride channel family protein
MEILLVGILICLLLSFLLYKSYKKRKKIFEQLSFTQSQNSNVKESKKYINNYIFASVISCLTLLFLFFILFEFRVFFADDNSNFDNSKNEIVFLLDVSNSMNANDVAVSDTKISRLNAAKKCMNSILENTYNSNFGLVIFAGQAKTIIPISQDKIFAKQILETIETNFITNQGTNIELGIDAAIQCFSNTSQSQTTQNKTIILLSDFENHNGNIESAMLNLKAKNIVIEAIGFGTESGSKIPIGNDEFLKEFNGRDVITSLNIAILQEISKNYYIYPFDLNLLLERIDATVNKTNNFFVLDSTLMTLNLFLIFIFLSILLSIFFRQP